MGIPGILGKMALGAGIYYGGNKLAEEYRGLTGQKGGQLWTGLGTAASTLIGGGMVAQGGMRLLGSGIRGTTRAFFPKPRKGSVGLRRERLSTQALLANEKKKYALAYNSGRSHPKLDYLQSRRKNIINSLSDRNEYLTDRISSRSDRANRMLLGRTKGYKAASKIESFLPSLGRNGIPASARLAGGFLLGASGGLLAGGAVAAGVGTYSSDRFRTRSNSGLDTAIGGMQMYDPISGQGPRRMGMDPFSDNSAGLVQALHKLR